MGNIVMFKPTVVTQKTVDKSCQTIDASRIRRKLDTGLVLPSSAKTDGESCMDHAADPIKDVNDIMRASRYLVENNRFRDNMLFIVGINFGLRVSDLLRLKFNMILDDDLTFKTSFPILEKKTRNTRKVKKNRYITINDAVADAVTMYLVWMSRSGKSVHMDDYLFKSESNRGSNKNKPMDRKSVDRILKSVAEDVGIKSKVSTHTLRKTFGYHQMVMSGNDPRKLLLLQKMFGHSTSAQTLDYIGITSEEIEDAYMCLNLGSKEYYQKVGSVVESAS